MTEALFVIYFLMLLATLVFKSRIIKGPWLFLLRAFFPNWKFFHAVGHVPHLYARSAVRLNDDAWQWSPWLLIYPRRQRRWHHVFHNADTNLGLAQQNLVDHFWADLYDLPEGADARELVTYTMVDRLVHQQLQMHYGAFTHYQFELRMQLDGRDGPVDEHTMMQTPVQAC